MKKRIPGLILEFILFVILLLIDIWLLSLIDNYYIYRFLLVFFSLPILWDFGKFVFIEILDIVLEIKYKLK